MLTKWMVALVGLALCSSSVQAAEDSPPPHKGAFHPALVIPLPDDFAPPPPPEDHEGRKGWFENAFGAIDKNGDGLISKEEMMAAWRERREDHGGEEHSDEPGEGFGSLSADDEELSDLPEPPPCGEDLRSRELTPQEENYPCSGSESVGNLIYRTVCNMDPYKSEAISLPFERAADCFGLEAIRGSGITFEIIEESTGTSVFNTADGKAAFETLVLTGGPSGTKVYRINLLSGDSSDASLTIRFIDHPVF